MTTVRNHTTSLSLQYATHGRLFKTILMKLIAYTYSLRSYMVGR